ncbi:hypothetical protein CAPTEDRAFT_186215 [Capitella teleta]|uniref:Uncharacterized protein n=1 Tax=Capitella teleta TaxID=283909 RepID=R7UC17_CAPTE|nr:hypothetical protein CAPTEDRAFT_186215 [Capitella teleta]|eukprot:ELU03656.1 hypothetical protein CAPTEDRAFT_186215 [Capitella teleta]
MASYNELTHTQSSDINSMDPLYRWDTHFPERLSKLHLHQDNPSPVARRQRARRNRNASRFKTQPITFDEIKEVDEETKDSTAVTSSAVESGTLQGIKSELAAFSRSMDGLLPGNRREKTREPSTDSNKENNPCDPCRGATSQDSNGNILSAKSSEPRSPRLTTAETTTSTGFKVPAGLPTERVGNSNRRKSRKKTTGSKGIAEEATEDKQSGADSAKASASTT